MTNFQGIKHRTTSRNTYLKPLLELDMLRLSEARTRIFVSVIFEGDTFWLTQPPMAELFEYTSDNISVHLKNIFKEEGLVEQATTEYFSVVEKKVAEMLKGM